MDNYKLLFAILMVAVITVKTSMAIDCKNVKCPDVDATTRTFQCLRSGGELQKADGVNNCCDRCIKVNICQYTSCLSVEQATCEKTGGKYIYADFAKRQCCDYCQCDSARCPPVDQNECSSKGKFYIPEDQVNGRRF
ncbi:hypothetical protein PPL_06527 [Heterostelium album PN500]|uniref:Uncharacterized protein n=1 Tax=Heterostelium pallidum (strain ATCC 26659 / Pp 5 / PN500) TaxID=670386 RepID=D3BDE4_HETP5|nr:hypothetical protein PPL_06527 [Heterostelium album PN500]EFA80588.1 hypothetical protein PPL_06527 [Heterostelium album PN500]|eukprot:XP_020432708.1 hypothetical protein PPL_06527 [Heterostelium album PN500]